MLMLYSILQRLFLFVKLAAARTLARLYRQSSVFVSASSVIMIMALTSGGVGSSGGSGLTVYAETNTAETGVLKELEGQENPGDERDFGGLSEQQRREAAVESPEEMKMDAGANIQADLTASQYQGQRIVGELLTQDIQKKAEAERRREEEEARQASAVVAYSEEDYQVLLRIVEAEAGICDEKGKILVANVVLNRVRSGNFPDTIKSVVYQGAQFSPVADGSINTCEVTEQTIDCVNRALAGEDYSQGALYFMCRSASRVRSVHWFDSRLTFLFRHEGHEFFK